jgi:hypothetical protein
VSAFYLMDVVISLRSVHDKWKPLDLIQWVLYTLKNAVCICNVFLFHTS